jgi:hypothetical protein
MDRILPIVDDDFVIFLLPLGRLTDAPEACAFTLNWPGRAFATLFPCPYKASCPLPYPPPSHKTPNIQPLNAQHSSKYNTLMIKKDIRSSQSHASARTLSHSALPAQGSYLEILSSVRCPRPIPIPIPYQPTIGRNEPGEILRNPHRYPYPR